MTLNLDVLKEHNEIESTPSHGRVFIAWYYNTTVGETKFQGRWSHLEETYAEDIFCVKLILNLFDVFKNS